MGLDGAKVPEPFFISTLKLVSIQDSKHIWGRGGVGGAETTYTFIQISIKTRNETYWRTFPPPSIGPPVSVMNLGHGAGRGVC